MKKRLFDALEASRAIQEFTLGLDFESFKRNDMVRAAVERKFEVTGEALNRAMEADPAIASQIPDIHRIVGLRNRIIHGYDAVDEEIVWDTIGSKIPRLIGQITDLIQELLDGLKDSPD